MISTPLPEYPWQVVGSDLFYHKGTTYLLVVNYFSRYPEISKPSTTTSQGFINALWPLFARHGVPEILRSGNGPQYVPQKMTKFSVDYGFQQITSSPHYPKSSGLAERTVQTIKMMLEKSTDPFLALLSYHATPLQWYGLSPSELLMGRRIRTTLPQVAQHLIPHWNYFVNKIRSTRVHKRGTMIDIVKSVLSLNLPMTHLSGSELITLSNLEESCQHLVNPDLIL